MLKCFMMGHGREMEKKNAPTPRHACVVYMPIPNIGEDKMFPV